MRKRERRTRNGKREALKWQKSSTFSDVLLLLLVITAFSRALSSWLLYHRLDRMTRLPSETRPPSDWQHHFSFAASLSRAVISERVSPALALALPVNRISNRGIEKRLLAFEGKIEREATKEKEKALKTLRHISEQFPPLRYFALRLVEKKWTFFIIMLGNREISWEQFIRSFVYADADVIKGNRREGGGRENDTFHSVRQLQYYPWPAFTRVWEMCLSDEKNERGERKRQKSLSTKNMQRIFPSLLIGRWKFEYEFVRVSVCIEWRCVGG